MSTAVVVQYRTRADAADLNQQLIEAVFKFLHPLRVARLQVLNIIGLILWSVLALIAVLEDLAPGPWVAGGLVVIALYFLGVGLAERR